MSAQDEAKHDANPDQETKAVVAFAGARDGYQLPLALGEVNLLEAFVTDMYWPADKKWFSSSVAELLPSHWIRARFHEGLDSCKVRVSSKAMAISACQKIAPQLGLTRYADKSLGRKARSIALRTNTAILCCSYYASEAFRVQPERPTYRFLFQLQADVRTRRRILLEEIERTPEARDSLSAEYELSLDEGEFRELSNEPHLANGWIATCSYAAGTLAEHGIPSDRIQIVPYGVDADTFIKRSKPPNLMRPFKIVYVGNLTQSKGLSYLLGAVRHLKSPRIQVVLCTRGVMDKKLLAGYSDLNIEIKVGLSGRRLANEIHNSDIFVTASLAEGFAHVVLEAMSCGLPVIATSHTCAPDVMMNGVHGFIVPIRDPEAIADKLAWGMDHRLELVAMGDAAAAQARLFTWNRFRDGVRGAYKKMIASVQ